MKAFLIGVVATIIVSGIAAVGLETLDMAASDIYRSPTSVRL